MGTAELQKYSKAYIAQIKAQEEAALKIKQDYFNKTGKVYDKEIKNLDKYENKITDLQKQIKALNDSKDDTIDAAIKRENARLQEQFDLLQKIKKTQTELANSKDSAYANSSSKTGFSEKELKSKVNTNKADIAKDVANAEYKNLLNTYQAISKERDEILKSSTDALEVEKALIQLASKYSLANVQTTEEFEKQLAILEQQKNFYRLLQNRGQLATEEKVNAEVKRRNDLLKEQKRLADEIAASQADILGDNGFNSTKQMNSQARNAKEILNGKNVQLTVDGASLTENGEDDIATQVSNSIKQNTDRVVTELKKAQDDYDDLQEPMNKLATQSERAADENDIKDAINMDKNQENQTRAALKDSETNINATTEASDNEVAKRIIRELSREDIVKSGGLINKGLDLLSDEEKFGDEAINVNKEILDKQLAFVTDNLEAAMTNSIENYEEFNKVLDEIVDNLDSMIPALKEEKGARQVATKDNIDSLRRKYGGDINSQVQQELEQAIKKETQDLKREEKVIDQAIDKINLLKRALAAMHQSTSTGADVLHNYGNRVDTTAIKIEKAAQQTQYLGSTFDDIKNKIGYFLSLNYIFDIMTQKIREAAQTTEEMDKDMTQIGLVLGQTSTQVWKNFDTYADMADRLNTTVSDVTGAMKLFYQQGLNTAEVNKMVEASAIAAALGESTMAEASETLTSIINSYSLTAEDAISVTDKISQVAIASAADFGEISIAIEKVASSAASAGLDLDHMMGYLGKMIETTREAPTNIGTALKTIVANFTQFKEDPTGLGEEGTEINKVDTALRSVGISLTDFNGEVRDLGDVLDELGGKWDSLTRNQKAYLATQIAGTRQQSRFYALMNDYDRTLELVEESTNSAGKANQQFELYQDSLTASTQKLNNEWEKFYNSILKNDSVLKGLKNTAAAVLGVANKLGAELTLLASGGIVKGLRTLWSSFAQMKEEIKESNSLLLSTNAISSKALNGNHNILEGYNLNHTNTDFLSQPFSKWAQKNFEKKGGNEQVAQLQKLLETQNALKDSNIELLTSNQAVLESFLETSEVTEVLDGNISTTVKNKAEDAVATQAGTVAHTASASVKWAEVAAQLALNIAITAGIAAIGAIVVGLVNWCNADKNAAIAAADHARTMQTAYEDLKNEYEDLKVVIEDYQKSLEALDRLIEGTDEWKQSVQELNSQVIELMGTFPELAKFISANSEGVFVISDEGLEKIQELQANTLSQAEVGSIVATQVANDAKIRLQQNEIANESYISSTKEDAWKGVNTEFFNVRHATEDDESVGDNSLSGYVSLKEQGMEKLYNEWKLNPSLFKEGSEDKLAAIIGTENKELITTIQKLEDKIIEWGKSIDLNTESNKILNQQIIHSYLGQNGSEEYQSSDYKAQIDSLLADEYATKKEEKLNEYNSKNDDTVHNEFAAKMGYTEIGGGFQVGKSKFVDKDGKELTFSDEYMREYLAGEAAKKEITNTEEGLSKEVNDLGVKLTGMFGEDAGKSLMSKFADGMDLNTLSPEDVKSIKESIDNGTLQLSETEAKLLGYNGSEQFKATVINAADNYNAIPYWQNQYTTSSKNAGDLQSSLNILSTGSEEDLEEEQISYLETLEAKYIELGEIKDRTSHEYLELLRQIKEQEETNAATALDETRILQEKQLQEAQDKLAASQAELAKDLTDEEREQIEMDIVANTEEVEEALKALSETKQKITVQLDADLKSDVEDAFGLANEFANLKDLLKENYEVTFEEAQEIAARGFGAILQNAKETSDQTIKLDEDTVNAYIDGKQTELSRDKEAKIKQLENQKTLLQTSLGLLQQEQAALTEVATAETEQDAQVALAKAMNYEAQYQAKRQELEEEVKADNEANKTMDENAAKLYESLSGMYEVNAENEQEATDAADKASAEHANNVIEYYKAMNNTVRQFANQVAVATQGKDNGEIKQGGVGSGGITVNDAGQKETTSGYTGEAKTIEDTLKDLVGGISDDSATRLNAMKQAAAQMSKDVSDRINTIQNQIGEIDSGIAALKSADTSLDKWQATKGGATGGGGSDDEYEGMIEKLEHFYNYLRQIEALEEKINKIRERRNLIDATQNYYIDDLIQENELLKEQAALYGNYINDEVEYLALLRNQLSAAYGDWVYFNDEGVVQVKQTEFAINSEEEEERYNAFSELLEEYQNEYNTMLQNQNLLYNIQATIIENINASYDKILKRITDVAEQLEYINSISEHWVEMSFGSIEKLPLLNDQIKTTADMLLNAQKGVNELNGDFEKLNQTIQNSDFTSLLTWDEELGHYKVNNEAMADPKVREQFEAQGYNWAEVETWVNSMAAASQKITTSVKETNTELMSARAQLKDLLEERISTISEIFEKATEEINKFYGIYEKKIEALGTENDLFGTKSENIDAQYDYLMNVAGHSKALLESLKKNNQDILDTLTKDYGDYVQMIDGVAYINKMAIEESDTLTEAQKADLLQLYQLYYESQDQIEEVNDKFYDYISQIEDLERAKRDAIIDLKNQLHDELIAKDQEEIDELSEKYDKMSALDNEYYSQLQQRINDARDARSRLQNQQDLAQMQNRLSVLQRDNSGQYNSELVELQRQINERLQAQADQNVDLEMERIAREQQQREEDRQMQITQMENLLTFKDENGMYWEMAQDIINNGTASVIGTLMSSKESEDQSDEARKQQLEDLQDTTEMAKAELSSGKEYLASNFREDLEKYVKEPVENLDIPGEMATHAGTVADQIAHGTQVFINTMSGLFRLLNEANGKSEAGGYTTGMIDDNGIYTPPTKKPVEPPKPAPAPSNNSSNSGAPELKVGNHVEVKPGTKWYYDSYGTSPTGKARSGKIKYINLKGSRPYNIEGLGWIRKEDIQGYSKGGYVDYTGIAAVHGKAGKPEAFLNAKQTQLFETLRDALVKVPTMSSKETDNSENITIENLTIDVKELADTDSVDKIVRTVKQSIYKDATSGNNMKINRR
jgi:TP901 family phage tail tape measure protein